MSSQSRADFLDYWNTPFNCPGQRDASVAPERVRELYDDYGASEKVLVDLGCATHGPMWESVHGLLFAASLEWLSAGTVNRESSGVIRMGC
jgi:hypothetical protein